MSFDERFIIVNDNSNEYIDPFVTFGDMSILMSEDTFARLYLHATIKYWFNPLIRMVSEFSDEYQNILFGDRYEDVTADLANDYNDR